MIYAIYIHYNDIDRYGIENQCIKKIIAIYNFSNGHQSKELIELSENTIKNLAYIIYQYKIMQQLFKMHDNNIYTPGLGL